MIFHQGAIKHVATSNYYDGKAAQNSKDAAPKDTHQTIHSANSGKVMVTA